VVSPQITANRSLPKEPVVTISVLTPDNESFTASISIPNQLKSNEEFMVEANGYKAAAVFLL
jgi:hypothetical protein